MPSTSAVGASSGPLFSQVSGNSPMGKDAFLKLLITQLQNQDPMNPMEDKEFISQLAQFSSLEQLQSVNQNTQSIFLSQSSFSALNLLGRDVEYLSSENGDVVKGKVDSIQFEGGIPVLKIGDKNISVSQIQKVS